MKAREALAVIALLLALAIQLGLGVAADGLTSDELLYVPAGHLQIARGDFSLNRTHPPLGPTLAGIGLLGAGARIPDRIDGEDDLAYCWRFLHRANAGRALWERARLPIVGLTLLLAAALWAWARFTFGPSAGLVALALAAFHPTLLAHGHLATTDLPAAAGMAGAAGAYWAWSARPSRARALVLAISLGLALAVRVTSGLVVPGFLVLEALALRRGHRRGRDLAGALATCIVVVPLLIAAAYGFDRHAFAAYLEGLRFQLDHNRRGHLTFLLGETARHGWPHYFAVALAVKSTPGFLLGLGAAAWTCVRSTDGQDVRRHWWLPAAIVFVTLSLGRIQIGERYLLPVHAFAILLVASATPRLQASRAGRIALGAILIGHVAPALAAAPRGYLAYFNRLAGGSEGAHRVLLDSNLDWGQDLPRLAAWMKRERVERIALAYDGADDPDRLGLVRDDLPGRNHYAPSTAEGPLRGTVVVSPSLVFGLVPREAARYAPLRERAPDARAGVFLVYRLAP